MVCYTETKNGYLVANGPSTSVEGSQKDRHITHAHELCSAQSQGTSVANITCARPSTANPYETHRRTWKQKQCAARLAQTGKQKLAQHHPRINQSLIAHETTKQKCTKQKKKSIQLLAFIGHTKSRNPNTHSCCTMRSKTMEQKAKLLEHQALTNVYIQVVRPWTFDDVKASKT